LRIRRQLQCLAWLSRPSRTGRLSDNWGREWGLPVDRWYIERFLTDHADDIRGDVLEVMDDRYTRRFGTSISSSSVLDIDRGNPNATLVADLQSPSTFPEDTFDCVVLTQTLQFVYDLQAATRSLHRMLRPGGVCLVTVPAVSRRDAGAHSGEEYWRLLPDGLGRTLGDVFGPDSVSVTSFGSARTAVGFLLGLAAEDFGPGELEANDPVSPLVTAARAVKPLAKKE
jgi:SAM-dependent methyltransferase